MGIRVTAATSSLRRIEVVGSVVLLVAGALSLGMHHAEATFPGANGKIAFTSYAVAPSAIWAMDADGSNQAPLGPDSSMNPAWSADGTKIAFTDEPNGYGTADIWVMNADGSNQVRLTDDQGIFEAYPTWSPDGAKIAYQRNDPDNGNLNEIYVMGADGSNQTPLTNGELGIFDARPAWSPDGAKIAFTAEPNGYGTADIYVMDADGSNLAPLTSDPDAEDWPTWSPDGTQIAFTSGPVFAPEIYVMNADGSNQVPLGAAGFGPAWSPDGTKIIFDSAMADIYVMGSDGSNQTQLTTGNSDLEPDWQPVPAPSIDFTWTMPDRFGADGDGNGLVDYYPPDGNLVIDPGTWEVDFTAGNPATCDATLFRTWFIDGVQVDPSDPNVIFLDPNSCSFKYAFPKEAVHGMSLDVKDVNGNLMGSAFHDVTVQDFLIVSIGDSVGSGEGNPDIPNPGHVWENSQCHRSASAGPAQAALLVEQADPRTSVTFIHLACSGATIAKGLLGPYEGIEPGALLPPQVDEMRTLVGTREIDAVLVSIGANDVKFSDIVQKCFLQTDCTDLNDPKSAASFFANRLPFLAPSYDNLATALSGNGDPPVDRVYITEYFDPTRDSRGTPCDAKILEDSPFAPLGEVTGAEAAWASNTMLTQLNGEVSSAAGRNGWHLVGGQFAEFATHGYCSGSRWVVIYSESKRRQGDKFGTLHPNVPGHADFGVHLQASLQQDLYIGGDLERPRAPR